MAVKWFGAGLGALRDRVARNEDGLSLVEVLVALSVLSVVLAGVAASAIQAIGLTRDNRDRVVASSLAAQRMEVLRSTPFTELVIGAQEQVVPVGATSFRVRTELSWIPTSAATGACNAPVSGPGSQPEYLRADVAVSWPEMLGTQPVTSQTILSPAVAVADPYSGHVAVSVTDRTGAPAPNHTVELTAPGVLQTRTTNSDGCAFFAFLNPGAYTVELRTNQPKVHIDRETYSTEPTKAVTVARSETTKIFFEYDAASSLTVTAVGDHGGTVPADLAYTLRNTAISAVQTKVFEGAGNPRTIAPLFPSDDGYDVWAGRCVEANPADAGGEVTVFDAPPGEVSSGDIILATIRVQVRDALGAVLPGRPVTAEMAGTCTDVDPSTTPDVDVLTLGTTDAAGELLVAMPYGTWQISAAGSAASATLTANAPGPRLVEVIGS